MEDTSKVESGSNTSVLEELNWQCKNQFEPLRMECKYQIQDIWSTYEFLNLYFILSFFLMHSDTVFRIHFWCEAAWKILILLKSEYTRV